MRAIIKENLQLLPRGHPMDWFVRQFQIPVDKVADLLAISLCPYHGIGEKGVHKNTYGRLVASITPTFWEPQNQAWFFEATSHTGNTINGVIWYRRFTDWHLASIEVVGSNPHISSVLVNSKTGRGFYLIGWMFRVSTQALDRLLWSALAPRVFKEDIGHIISKGYSLKQDTNDPNRLPNPFDMYRVIHL